MYLQAEVLHDFEAANEDELNLIRGDIVFVLASATSADQVKNIYTFCFLDIYGLFQLPDIIILPLYQKTLASTLITWNDTSAHEVWSKGYYL